MVIRAQNSTAADHRARGGTWLTAGVVLWFAALLLLLFGLAMRRHFNHDEHQFVASAALIARDGLLPYRDFPYFHVPTLSFLYALIFQFTDYLLLGARAFSVLASWLLLLLLLGTALTWLRNLSVGRRVWIGLLLTLLLVSTPSFLHASGAAWNHDFPILLVSLATVLQVTWLRRARQPLFWVAVIGFLLGSATGVRSSFALTLPVFALAVLLKLGWRQRSGWLALLWLGIGGALGMLPVFYTFIQAPAEFIFGNLTYARLNAAYYAEVSTATTPLTLGQKFLRTLQYIVLEPGNLLMLLLAGAALWRVRSQFGVRSSPELLFLLLLLASLLAGAFAPSPLQPQYIYVLFPTFALLFLAALARDPQPRYGVWAVSAAALLAALLAAPRLAEGAAILPFPAEWLPVEVHTRGELLASLAGPAPMVTLAPVYPLEGKAAIDPAFATGPFGWRVAPLLTPAERQRFGLKGAADLPAAAANLPHAILTGIHDNDADSEAPLVAYAQAHGYAPMPAPAQGALWLRPQAAFGDAIRLVTTALPATPLAPGEALPVTLYLQATRPITEDLNILLRVTAASDQDLLRSEGWPWGRPTSTWRAGDIWPDGHSLTVPLDAAPGPYKLEVSFYDPTTLELLGQPATPGYIVVRSPAQTPAGAPLATFADGLTLVAADLPEPPWAPGDVADVRLTWRADTLARGRYTTFVHMVGADGLVAQYDQEPFGGFFPTAAWPAGVPLTDGYPLTLPADLPAGEYQLFAGLYDAVTGQRLAWLDHGAPAGDAFPFATIQVR